MRAIAALAMAVGIIGTTVVAGGSVTYFGDKNCRSVLLSTPVSPTTKLPFDTPYTFVYGSAPAATVIEAQGVTTFFTLNLTTTLSGLLRAHYRVWSADEEFTAINVQFALPPVQPEACVSIVDWTYMGQNVTVLAGPQSGDSVARGLIAQQ